MKTGKCFRPTAAGSPINPTNQAERKHTCGRFLAPAASGRFQPEGGTEPVWARNGRELFYRNDDKMMATVVETKPTFAAARPKLLFEGHYETGSFSFQPNYDVSPDGQRFLMIKPGEQESAATQVNVVLNWSDEVRRLVPAGRR